MTFSPFSTRRVGSEDAAKLLSEAEEASHQLIEYYEENFDD